MHFNFIKFKKPKQGVLWSVMIILGSLFVAPAMAQGVRVEAEVNARTIALGSTVQLTITVHGNNNIEAFDLPKIEGMETRYLGPSTRVSIINGQYASSKSFMYSLFPTKVGKFKIPSFQVTAAGRNFTIEPIDIEVVASMDSVTTSPDDQHVSLEDKLFVVMKVPKHEVYLNEPLPVKILLFVGGLSARDIQYPQMNTIGFTMAEYDRPQQFQQVANNMRYDVVEFNTKIYPSRVGELRLGPARIDCNIMVASRRSNLGRGASVFDDDFFNSFFDRGQKQPVSLESDETLIRVLPLPEEGRPDDFDGAVGQYNFNVAVSPDEVNEGDPVTVRMTIIGEGNMASVQVPGFPAGDDFKFYDPQIFEEGNIKKSEQVVIPNSHTVTEIPALRFSFFDPQLKKYRTITNGPFPITVNQLDHVENFKVVGADGEYRPVQTETLGSDIVFIKNSPGHLRKAGEYLFASGMYYFGLVMFAFLWIAAYFGIQHTRRLKTDVVYARKLCAPRYAKKGIAKAKILLAQSKTAEFYDMIFKTAQVYLGNKLHLSSGAVTSGTVEQELHARSVDPKTIDEIKSIFEECDRVRYAQAGIDRGDMEISFQRLVNSIDHLERSLK